jgi:hypothetical protein
VPLIVLKVLALIFVLLVWTIIGPFLWIPLLIRSFAFVTFNLMAAVVTGASMAPAQISLDAALGLYGRGFLAAFAILDETSSTPAPVLPHSNGYGRLLSELLYVALFWVASVGLILWLLRLSPPPLRQPSRNGSASMPKTTSITEIDSMKPAPKPRARKPAFMITNRGFLFKLYSCNFSDADTVRCGITVENTQNVERRFTFVIGGSESAARRETTGATFADDRGNWYISDRGSLGRSQIGHCSEDVGCDVGTVALPGVVIPLTVEFDNVDSAAMTAKLLRINFNTGGDDWLPSVIFRELRLRNDGPNA